MKSHIPIPPQLVVAKRAMRGNLIAVGLFSAIVNILMLTGPIFMLQVYDRVLTSQSVNTLLGLAILAASLYLFMGIIDAARVRVLVSMGHRFEQRLAGMAFASGLSAPASGRPAGGNAIRNVEQIRSFLSGQGAAALFDLPWMPIYFGLVFALHVWLGFLGIAGAVVLIIVALVTDRAVRKATAVQSEHAGRRASLAETSRRNAELVRAMGMQTNLTSKWQRLNERFIGASSRSAVTVALSSSVTKVFRLALQSTILAVAAYLAIHNQLSPGSIVAASVIISRGLQPIETLVGGWRGIVGAQRAWSQLKAILATQPDDAQIEMPDPKSSLSVDDLYVVPPGDTKPTLKGVSLELSSGEALAVIGSTGCGKSTFARALVSAWTISRGSVCFDGVPANQFRPENLGRQIGYLPQDVELFEGTLAENIARFDPEAEDSAVIAAAKTAGVHELITSLDGGYTAVVGEQGAALSGGQRQRIALGRALYGNPFLVVLDEPNSNLDAAGEAALNAAIASAKARGAIVVVIAHRPSVLGAVDKVLVMDDGHSVDFGSRDDVLNRLRERNEAALRGAQPVSKLGKPQEPRGSETPPATATAAG